MKKNVWIIKGFGDSNPEKISVSETVTVRDLKERYADELGVSSDEIEIATDTKRLNNNNSRVYDLVEDGETINILPRAYAGY